MDQAEKGFPCAILPLSGLDDAVTRKGTGSAPWSCLTADLWGYLIVPRRQRAEI
jgi:hypothetical protein